MKHKSLPGLFLALLWVQTVWAGDCAPFTGRKTTLADGDARYLKAAVNIINNKKRKELSALTGERLLFVRQFLSGNPRQRGGNLWLEIKPGQIDNKLNIHVTGQIPLDDLWILKPNIGGNVFAIDHSICLGAEECQVVPSARELASFIYPLLVCNHITNYDPSSVFLFSDGILLTSMEDLHPGEGPPDGMAWFFSKTPSGHRLSVLISFQ